MKSKQLKSYNLSPDRAYNEVLDAKPYLLFTLIAVVGVVFITRALLIPGSILVVTGILSLLIFPPRRLIEFYDDNMILYNKASKADCVDIYYDEIESWKYIQGVKDDEIIFKMLDGSEQKISAYSKLRFEKCLNKYLKDKNIKGESIWKFQRH